MFRLLEPELSEPYQTISSVGLSQMLATIPRHELIEAIRKLEGFRHVNGEFQIPSKYFQGK